MLNSPKVPPVRVNMTIAVKSLEPELWQPIYVMVRNVNQHRNLIFDLAWRDLRSRYKGSYLGFLWTFLNPLLLMATYSVIFSFMSRFDIPHYAMYVLLNVVVWQFLSVSILESATALQNSSSLISKTSLPPEIIIAKTVLAHALNFIMALFVTLTVGIIFFHVSGWLLLSLPFVILILVLFSFLASIFVGLISVFFRDVQPVLANIMTVIFFASPIVYAYDHTPAKAKAALLFQPFAQLLRLSSDLFFWNRWPAWSCLTAIFFHLIILMFLAAWALSFTRGRIAEKI